MGGLRGRGRKWVALWCKKDKCASRQAALKNLRCFVRTELDASRRFGPESHLFYCSSHSLLSFILKNSSCQFFSFFYLLFYYLFFLLLLLLFNFSNFFLIIIVTITDYSISVVFKLANSLLSAVSFALSLLLVLVIL